MRSWLLPAFFSTVCTVVTSGCTDDVEVRLEASGFALDDVVLEVENLGKLKPQALSALRRRGDIDGATLLSDADCAGPCQVLLVSLFVTNAGNEGAAPPVVRFSSPPGKPVRVPIAYTGEEISPLRMGRIRFLVALWPDEDALTVRLSGSVFIEVKTGAGASPTADGTEPAPIRPAPSSPPASPPAGSANGS